LGIRQVAAAQQHQLRVFVANEGGLALALSAEEIARAAEQLSGPVEVAEIGVMRDRRVAAGGEIKYLCLDSNPQLRG